MQTENQVQIPNLMQQTPETLAVTAPNFAAFKAEEKVSFIRAYDPKAQAIEGYRHSILRWRQTDKNTVAKPAKMVTIPQITLDDNYLMPEVAAKVFVGLLEDAQDAIIKSLYDTKGVTNIGWDMLSLDAVLADITATKVSNRLTKEQVQAWATVAFVDCCKERALEIAQAKGYDEATTAKQVAGTLNRYVGLASKMAAPIPNIGQEEAKALETMMKKGKLADDMAKVILSKLDSILRPAVLGNDEYL